MAWFLLRRSNPFPFLATPARSKACSLCTEGFRALQKVEGSELKTPTVRDKLSPLLPFSRDHPKGFGIELVDPDLWQVSSGLAHAWRGDWMPESSKGLVKGAANSPPIEKEVVVGEEEEEEECPGFDEIEDLRLHKKLFYKLDRDSKEFEEYNLILPGKNSSKKGRGKPIQSSLKEEFKNKGKPDPKLAPGGSELTKQKRKVAPKEMGSCHTEGCRIGTKAEVVEGKKKVRTPTYNQLTDPYHLPFCLDIYLSKGSVRACIVHRATCKVVVVAHSISKDMKFDLTSRKDATACAAVGQVLAQRAIADDIHNIVYTPRKGEKIEGKFQIVLQSIVDNGIDVKVKIKQRRPSKARFAKSCQCAVRAGIYGKTGKPAKSQQAARKPRKFVL